MSLKKQLKEALLYVADEIESGNIVPGLHSASARNLQGEILGPSCALGWVAVATGLRPDDGYALLNFFNLERHLVYVPNDSGDYELLVKNLRKLSKKL